MHLALIEQSTVVKITHKDQSVQMSMSIYREGRRDTSSLEVIDPFADLNKFLAKMTEEDQDKVFQFYVDAQEVFMSTYDVSQMGNKLKNLIKDLYEVVRMDDVRHWVQYYALGKTISVPNSIQGSIDDIPDKSLVTRERTYLKEDYIELVCYILALRLIAPIWSEYIKRTRSHHGNEWKEYYAFKLLSRSAMGDCEAVDRLERYVDCTAAKFNTPHSAIVGGVSQEDYPIWLMAQVLVRRVIMGDITGHPDNPASLVVIIFKYVEHRAQQSEKAFAGRVKVKSPPSEKKSDIDTMCVLETYNTRQAVNDGYIEMFNVYLENPYEVAWHLDPTIPKELIDEALCSQQDLLTGEIKEGQLTITQWVLNQLVPARALVYVDKPALINGMLATRAYLWHNGHYSLCALATALPVEAGYSVPILTSERRSRVTSELLGRLGEYFPYYRHVAGKTTNPTLNIMNTLSNVTEYFTRDQWQLTLPEAWLRQGKIANQGMFYSAQEDVKIDLAELAMQLAQLKSNYYEPEAAAPVAGGLTI